MATDNLTPSEQFTQKITIAFKVLPSVKLLVERDYIVCIILLTLLIGYFSTDNNNYPTFIQFSKKNSTYANNGLKDVYWKKRNFVEMSNNITKGESGIETRTIE